MMMSLLNGRLNLTNYSKIFYIHSKSMLNQLSLLLQNHSLSPLMLLLFSLVLFYFNQTQIIKFKLFHITRVFSTLKNKNFPLTTKNFALSLCAVSPLMILSQSTLNLQLLFSLTLTHSYFSLNVKVMSLHNNTKPKCFLQIFLTSVSYILLVQT